MKVLLAVILGLFFSTCSVARTVSYVVLDWCSLVRVSEDGKSRQTITDAACGYRQGIELPGSSSASGSYGLALDGDGNYIVAARSSLLKVTPTGQVSLIAKAPEGTAWLAVAVDLKGNFITADNRNHAIWRVSGDGQTVAKIANYPAPAPNSWEDVGIAVDPSGDYFVIEENGGTWFVRLTPTGSVVPIRLHGESIARGCRITGDGKGDYLVTSLDENTIFHVTPDGEVTTFAKVDSPGSLMSLTRNPDAGEVVVATGPGPSSQLLRFNSYGGTGGLSENLHLSYPKAIITEFRK